MCLHVPVCACMCMCIVCMCVRMCICVCVHCLYEFIPFDGNLAPSVDKTGLSLGSLFTITHQIF